MAKPQSFKPGDPRINRKGAPKREWTWSGVLQKAVQKKMKSGGEIKELIAQSLIDEAIKGNVVAIKELMNRMDGMPQQDMDVTSEGKSIVIEHIYKDGTTRKDTI